MTWIYLAAAIFGGMFVIPMILGGLDLDTDVDAEFGGGDVGDLGGTEFDADTDLDVDADATTETGDTAIDAVGSFVSSLLSFRSLVFFLSFFGLAGIIFNVIGSGSVVTFLTALGLGLIAAVLNAQLFSYLKRTGSSSQRLSRDIEGHSARVILPISGSQKGRIRTDLGGQPTFMVALPFGDSGTFDVGDSVVVVEVNNGTALVAELALGETEQAEEK